MDGGGIHFGESKCSLRTGQEPLRGVRAQCSLGTGPNNKTPKECGAKLITVGARMPTVVKLTTVSSVVLPKVLTEDGAGAPEGSERAVLAGYGAKQ